MGVSLSQRVERHGSFDWGYDGENALECMIPHPMLPIWQGANEAPLFFFVRYPFFLFGAFFP
jgi:hypothetical protein